MLKGKASLDIGFVGITIGYGILIGRTSSRKWALFLSLIGLILIVGIGGWITYKQVTIGDQPLFADGMSPLIELILAAACCLCVAVVLLSKKHKAWFDSIKKDPGPAKSLSWSVAIAATVVMTAHQAYELSVQETFHKMYTYRVRVAPYNADTGENINSIAFMSDPDSSEKDSIALLPKGHVRILGGTDGMQIEFSGVAAAPVKGTLRSDGFQDTPLTLVQHTEPEIRIPMKPLSPGAGKPGDTAPK